MSYSINNIDDFWSRIQTAAVNFNVFPSFVESLPDFRRFVMILYNTPPPPLSLLLWLFFVLHTVRPLRSSGEKKALSSLTYLTLSFVSFDVFIVFSVL